MADVMLGEMQVIDAVCDLLEEQGYRIDFRVEKLSDQGPDIIATCKADGRVIIVEAKGQTSSDKNSKRFGLEFNLKQMNSHLGIALLKSLQIVSGRIPKEVSEVLGEDVEHLQRLPAIAFPDNHEHLIDSISSAFSKLGGIVFLISDNEKARVHTGKLPPCKKR